MKKIIKLLLPPVLYNLLIKINNKKYFKKGYKDSIKQELDIYWDPKMAAALETWGEDNAWQEVQLIFSGLKGRVLDIACGTGVVIEILNNVKGIEVHGCDISDFLLSKAIMRGILEERLRCCDATDMPYPDNSFDYAYSIGSLEHFTEEGISKLLSESSRITKVASFHMIPVSSSGVDEGWIQPYQSYFNNSVDWWVKRASAIFSRVVVVPSSWRDVRSGGIWLICYK